MDSRICGCVVLRLVFYGVDFLSGSLGFIDSGCGFTQRYSVLSEVVVYQCQHGLALPAGTIGTLESIRESSYFGKRNGARRCAARDSWLTFSEQHLPSLRGYGGCFLFATHHQIPLHPHAPFHANGHYCFGLKGVAQILTTLLLI